MLKRSILLPIATLVIGLFSCVSATMAWFTANSTVNSAIDGIAAVAVGSELDSVSLYKFEYPTIEIGNEMVTDYLAPEGGHVSKYAFNSEEGKFGHEENEQFVACDVMNLYDPLDVMISGLDLISLNCNVIYEVKLAVGAGTTSTIRALSELIQKAIQTNQLNASNCFDFDLYCPSDLESPLLYNGSTKLYVPSHKGANATLTEEEEVYYKLSYLSSLSSSHANFYDEDENDTIEIGSKEVVGDEEGNATVYINANYSVQQLERYATTMTFDITRVVYDYRFVFNVI